MAIPRRDRSNRPGGDTPSPPISPGRLHRLGDLQLAILDVLWEKASATVAEVHAQLLPTRGLALTTIATMLRKMEDRRLVRHEQDGRQYIYFPQVDANQVQRSMTADITDRLFGGSVTALVSHLLDESEVDPEEVDELRRLVDAKRRELNQADRQQQGGGRKPHA
ncbi:MAG: BlaI/MecI/CopY family transcriptional regulator [Planctomycetes bacterium]|nr:BlaI/MecI/CopY family transcriptional regulator [Planctomycetota bacterium]NOG53307.1 BlaI/MecI/CopY family transcriptional regulator [Planctomycetota bacterium]